jgi:hypothetical protein
MLLLIDIFSINKGQGYENPSLEIIVTECCSTGGCPLEEACEHCFLNQSAISVVVLILFLCYCGDYAGYITVILPFLAFYFCSAYLLYLVSCILGSLNITCHWCSCETLLCMGHNILIMHIDFRHFIIIFYCYIKNLSFHISD